MAGKESDSERFEALFQAHRSAILGYAMRRADSTDEAADVLSETFATAWRRLDEVPTGEKTLPWLYGTAGNVLANARRSGRRRDALAVRATNELVVAIEASMNAAVDFGPREELSDQTRAALMSLREDEREILLLVAWEGLKPGDAGRALGINPATARTRIHRARRKLSAALNAGTQADPLLLTNVSQEEGR